MKIQNIGVTYRNRTLKLIQIQEKSRFRKPIIWIDAGIHAREWIAPSTATYFIYKLLTEYGINKQITHLIQSYDWYIMPLVNPDGYDYSFRTNRLWRKNRSKSVWHNEGVDLNRNFPYEWNNKLTSPSARKPTSLDYIGPFPMSENETQAIHKILMNVNKRVKLFLSLHSYGQYILFPWGCKTENIKDYDYLKRMGEHAAEEIKNLYGTEYTVDSTIKALYSAPGISIDWSYGHFGIKHSFVIELRDKGVQGFKLKKKYIIPVGEETWRGVQSLASDILDEVYGK
uniref:Carboxypeptidase B n=1 Tax=Tityus serrulatus TaxID=6887 RepID=A0A1S5QN48_TITSE|nr:carboxypeptidase B [Tityus serrulatus]